MTRLREIKQERSKPVFSTEKKGAKIINCRVSGVKLITQLEDGREISIPVSLLTKWSVIGKNVQAEQLKKNEIRSEGRLIYFPDIDEALPTWKIAEGLFSCN